MGGQPARTAHYPQAMRRLEATRSTRLAVGLGAAALGSALALSGCGGSSKPATTAAKPAKPVAAASPRLGFGKGSSPLGYVDHGIVSHRGAIAVHDVSYSSGGHRIGGYLIEQAGAPARPAVILVHGSGGDRGELLGDAIALAKRGVVAMTITEPSSAYPLPTPTSAAQLLSESRKTVEEDVVAVRRAADVLQSLKAVDPARIGYLGWSAGAKTGAFVVASDPRFKAFALLSGGADPVSAFVAAAPASMRSQVKIVLGSVDPLRYLGYGRPRTILLEDGTRDSVVPHEALENFIHAAPAGTVVHWYGADHQLTTAAYATAFAWLAARLS